MLPLMWYHYQRIDQESNRLAQYIGELNFSEYTETNFLDIFRNELPNYLGQEMTIWLSALG